MDQLWTRKSEGTQGSVKQSSPKTVKESKRDKREGYFV